MVDENKPDQAGSEETNPISFAEFLETIPPGRITRVEIIVRRDNRYKSEERYYFLTPDIQLHCSNENCSGPRFFECQDHRPTLYETNSVDLFLTYLCRNCQKSVKTYAIKVYPDPIRVGKGWYISKYGEQPDFGPPTPARVIKLIGPDRELFLKGRRSENKGLGIGAYAYYRRVVENQKNRIFDEIISVAEKISTPADLIDQLKAAKSETQFTKAIESIKDSIPQVLLIDGHNPLTLLHSALSEGLHAQSDEECLELATSIRVVLTELAERLGSALKEEAELKSAVSRLLHRAKQKGKGKDNN